MRGNYSILARVGRSAFYCGNQNKATVLLMAENNPYDAPVSRDLKYVRTLRI